MLNSPRPGAWAPACMDCGGALQHDDTCPQRVEMLDLLDDDLAALAASGGRPFTRGLHAAEAAMFAGAGRPIPRQDRVRWRVRVHPYGSDGVRRDIRRAGVWVAELIDASVAASSA